VVLLGVSQAKRPEEHYGSSGVPQGEKPEKHREFRLLQCK
jgi:hypothetical protein